MWVNGFLNSQYHFCNHKVDQYTKNIIAGGNKRPSGDGRVDSPFMQEQWGKGANKTGYDNHGDQGNGYGQCGHKITFPDPSEQ